MAFCTGGAVFYKFQRRLQALLGSRFSAAHGLRKALLHEQISHVFF